MHIANKQGEISMCDYCKPIDKSTLKDNELIVFGIYSDFKIPNQTKFMYCPMCRKKVK